MFSWNQIKMYAALIIQTASNTYFKGKYFAEGKHSCDREINFVHSVFMDNRLNVYLNVKEYTTHGLNLRLLKINIQNSKQIK